MQSTETVNVVGWLVLQVVVCEDAVMKFIAYKLPDGVLLFGTKVAPIKWELGRATQRAFKFDQQHLDVTIGP